jgi:hypothetical protein
MRKAGVLLTLIPAMFTAGTPSQDVGFVDEFGGGGAPPPAAAAFAGQQQIGGFNQGGFEQAGAFPSVGFGGPTPNDGGFGGAAPNNAFFAGAPTQGGFTEIPTNTINVVSGAWIRDAVDGTLLEVPEMARVPESQRENFFDDGENGNDVQEGDEIFTNVEIWDQDFIGPVSQSYVLRYINMLRLLHGMDPLSFAAVKVASPDPVSPLPLLDDFQTNQQDRVEGWNEKFLNPFRMPDVTGQVAAQGEFYPVYIPPPPYYRPIRPSSLNATPDLGFLQEAWVLYNGGTPDTQRLVYLNDTQQQQGYYGEEGFAGAPGPAPGAAVPGGDDVFGGSAGAEYDGQRSTYINVGGPK